MIIRHIIDYQCTATNPLSDLTAEELRKYEEVIARKLAEIHDQQLEDELTGTIEGEFRVVGLKALPEGKEQAT